MHATCSQNHNRQINKKIKKKGACTWVEDSTFNLSSLQVLTQVSFD